MLIKRKLSRFPWWHGSVIKISPGRRISSARDQTLFSRESPDPSSRAEISRARARVRPTDRISRVPRCETKFRVRREARFFAAGRRAMTFHARPARRPTRPQRRVFGRSCIADARGSAREGVRLAREANARAGIGIIESFAKNTRARGAKCKIGDGRFFLGRKSLKRKVEA